MPCASSAPGQVLPSTATPEPLLALARLLAREAARAEFATRCKSGDREAGNG